MHDSQGTAKKTVTVSISCSGGHEKVLDLHQSRLRVLRDKALAGKYGEDICRRFAAHENSYNESLLMAAIDYCEERIRKNHAEIDKVGLETGMLRAEISGVEENLKKLKTEISKYEWDIGRYGPELGTAYREKTAHFEKSIFDALSGLSKVSKKAGLLAGEGQDLRELVIASLKTDAKITEKNGLMTVELGPESSAKISEMIDAKVGRAEWGEAALVPQLNRGDAAVGQFRLRVQKVVNMCADTLIENSGLIHKMMPDRTAKRIILMRGGCADWLDCPSAKAAAKADEKAANDAAKELRKYKADCKHNEKTLGELLKMVREEIHLSSSSRRDMQKAKQEGRIIPGMEESLEEYVKAVGEMLPKLEALVGPIEILREVNRELAETLGDYQKAVSIYPVACKKAAELEKRIASPDGYEEKKNRLEELDDMIRKKNGRIKTLEVMQKRLKAELDSIVRKRTEKAWKRMQHIENSPKAKPVVKTVFFRAAETAVDAELEKQRKTGNAIRILINNALEEYPDFAKCHSKQKSNFEFTVMKLGQIYIENGCKMGQQHILNEPVFKNRAKHEPNRTMQGGAYKLVRLGIESTNKYRLIIDVANPVKPEILFAGNKESCDKFLDKQSYATVKRGDLFSVLRGI